MPLCSIEQQTHHHLGLFYGFGPVADNETVLFAIFENTNRADGQLSNDSFSANLNNRTQSLARRSYVPWRDFRTSIVQGRTLDGVSRASVRQIRALRADFATAAGMVNVRAMCVIDLVEPGDCDGHATMGFAPDMQIAGISQGQLGKKRAAVKLDLADTFSEILPPDHIRWVGIYWMPLKRLGALVRATFSWGRNRLNG